MDVTSADVVLLLAAFVFSSVFLWPLPRFVHHLPKRWQSVIIIAEQRSAITKALILAAVLTVVVGAVLWLALIWLV